MEAFAHLHSDARTGLWGWHGKGLWIPKRTFWLTPWPLLRDSVRLVIRKVQFAPPEPGPGPWAQTTRRFLLSSQPLQLQAWMETEVCGAPFLSRTP